MKWQVMLATGGHFTLDGSSLSWARPDGSVVDCSSWSNRRASEFLTANAVGGFDSARLEMLRDKLRHRIRRPTVTLDMLSSAPLRERVRERLLSMGATEEADNSLVIDPDGDGIAYADSGLVWFVKVFGHQNVSALRVLAVWLDALNGDGATNHEVHVVQDGVSDGGRVLKNARALESVVEQLGFDNGLTSLGDLPKRIPELGALLRRICTMPPLQRAGAGAMRQVAF